MNKVYLDKQNRLIFPFSYSLAEEKFRTFCCYRTVNPLGSNELDTIMQMIYLFPNGDCSYNDEDKVISELQPSSKLYRQNQIFIRNIKKLLKNCEYKHFYCNAIIFPRSIFDADI